MVRAPKKSFASGTDFYKLFWVFMIGCFLGVVIETLFCLVLNGYIESRQGLVYGPFNPVYGFGAVLMTLVVFMILNMTISALAVNRWTQREEGISENSSFDEFLDQTYPDNFIEKIYPNMVKVGHP